MTRDGEPASRGRERSAWLREELAPRPGRFAAVMRIAGSCAIAVAIAMAFQIPLPEYVVYLVFVISRRESVATLITAVGVAVGATLAVALALVLLTVDAGDPALRLPLMAGIAFLTMLLARVSTLGPLAYLVGFIMVLTQTMVDTIPSPEMLTRLVLWLWVVVMIPAAVSTLVNLVFGDDPAKLAQQTALRLLDAVTARLDDRHSPELARHQADALGLVALRKDAQIADRQLREYAEVDHRLIETLVELLTLLRAIPPDLPRDVRMLLVEASEECRRALASAGAPAPRRRPVPPALLEGLAADILPIVVAIDGALGRLGNDIARRRAAGESPPGRTPTNLFVPDAWSNPEHARFALKTTIAVMAAYFIYSVVNWPGISTAVPTCFVVALGSMGETIHKMWLRICRSVDRRARGGSVHRVSAAAHDRHRSTLPAGRCGVGDLRLGRDQQRPPLLYGHADGARLSPRHAARLWSKHELDGVVGPRCRHSPWQSADVDRLQRGLADKRPGPRPRRHRAGTTRVGKPDARCGSSPDQCTARRGAETDRGTALHVGCRIRDEAAAGSRAA